MESLTNKENTWLNGVIHSLKTIRELSDLLIKEIELVKATGSSNNRTIPNTFICNKVLYFKVNRGNNNIVWECLGLGVEPSWRGIIPIREIKAIWENEKLFKNPIFVNKIGFNKYKYERLQNGGWVRIEGGV